MAKDGTNRGGARPGAGRRRKSTEEVSDRTYFTPEQLKELIDSPHVAYISRTTVSFTKAFKEAAWQRYCDGVDPKQIFRDAGLNIEVLGRGRIDTFFKALRKAKAMGYEFTEGNEPYNKGDEGGEGEDAPSFPKPPRLPTRGHPPLMSESQINHLATQVAYMSQEIEFIKKIILAEPKGK